MLIEVGRIAGGNLGLFDAETVIGVSRQGNGLVGCEAVSNVEEIAAVPNIGTIFFGPWNLAVSKGIGRNAFEPDVRAERERV